MPPAAPVRTALCLAITALAGLAPAAPAGAQETVDIGVLRDEDISVVQNVLYPKRGALEVGGHLGWMPFDPLVTAPNAQISIDKHFSDTLAVSVMVGGGFGLKTQRYADIESSAEAFAPYAYRYLASALVGVSWAPVYGKLTATGRKVVHYDVYGTARAGVTIEQSVIPIPGPSFGVTAAPTASLGVGARFFVGENLAVRLELRDDLLAQYRELTTRWAFKQNAGITIGVTGFLGRRR